MYYEEENKHLHEVQNRDLCKSKDSASTPKTQGRDWREDTFEYFSTPSHLKNSI